MSEHLPPVGRAAEPTREFWEALLVVYNCYHAHKIGLLRFTETPMIVQDALRTVDRWIDYYVEDEWEHKFKQRLL